MNERKTMGRKYVLLTLIFGLAAALTVPAIMQRARASSAPAPTRLSHNSLAASDATAAANQPGVPAAVWEAFRQTTPQANLPGATSNTPSSQIKLLANDKAAGAHFGFSSAISGSFAVIGARDAGGTGAAYVFIRSGGTWTQEARLVGSDSATGDYFGYSVAIAGGTIIVGAPKHDTASGVDSGSAYFFTRSGTSWIQQAELFGSDSAASDNFGYTVAISGATAVIGAPFDNTSAGTRAGSAYVFTSSGTVWNEQAHLFASDGAASDYFGNAVAVDGDTAIVGAYHDRTTAGGSQAGSAYVFLRSGTAWAEQAHLFASGGAAYDNFGISVALDGDTALIGAYGWSNGASWSIGAAYVFVRSGTNWIQQARLLASDGVAMDEFGWSVALEGDTAVIGAVFDVVPATSGLGSLYIFKRSVTAWTQQDHLWASDGAPNDQLGYSLAMSAGALLSGAAWDDDATVGADAGSAYVWDMPQSFVLSNEGGNGLISQLVAAGYGDYNLYDALIAIRANADPSVSSIITDAFLSTLAGQPASSPIFTTQLSSVNTPGQSVAINTDGTVQVVSIFGATYQGAAGVSTLVADVSGVGNAKFLSRGTITSFTSDGKTYNVFGIGFSGEQTFVLSNEGGNGLVSQLLAAGYGNLNLYQVLVQIVNDTNPPVSGIITPAFLQTLASQAPSSPIFTTQLHNISIGTQALAINTDGTFQVVGIFGSTYFGQPGTATLGSDISGVGRGLFTHSMSDGTPLTSFNPGATTYNVFGIGWTPNQPPVAVCHDVTVEAGPGCTANASIDNGSFDPDGDPITLLQTPPGPYSLGATLVTLTVTDSHDASSQCTATVTVLDHTPPIITCPPNLTQITDLNGCSAVVTFADPTVTDNCPPCSVQTRPGQNPQTQVGCPVACSPASGSTFQKGVTTVTCTVTDASNNTAQCSFTVTVNDTQPPVMSLAVSGSGCTLPPTGIAAWWPGDNNANDISGNGNNGTPQNGAAFMPAGKVAQAFSLNGTSQYFEAPDSPSLRIPTALTLDAWVNTAGSTTAQVIAAKAQSGGNWHSYYLALDDTGNLVLEIDNISTGTYGIWETTAPPSMNTWHHVAATWQNSFGDTRDAKIYVDGVQQTAPLTITQGYGPGFALYYTELPFAIGTSEMHNYFFNGLIDEVELFNRVLTDSEIYSIYNAGSNGKCKSPFSTTTNQCSAVVNFVVTATDNCPGVGTPVCSPASGTAFPIGITTVTCSVSDSAGNNATASFAVRVADSQPPSLTCPSNVVRGTDPNQCSAVVTFNTPVTDNCSGATASCTPASGSTFPKGVTTITCTASDGAGNNVSCDFTVTINDTQAPSITCPANITQTADLNGCSAVVTFVDPTVIDNCPPCTAPEKPGTGPAFQGCSVVCSPASGSTFQKGVTSVTCTATDASNNTAQCSFTVTINDTQAPATTCPANITRNTDPNACTAVVTFADPTVTDNCPPCNVEAPSKLGQSAQTQVGCSVVCSPSSGSAFPKGVTTVTCTATDASNNTAQCSFTVTVNDTQAPTITCPANVTKGTDPNACTAVVPYANATATDNCPGVGTPVCTPASGSVFPKGVTTISCTVSDASSNSANCTFTVTVNDTQHPTVTCPNDITFTTPGASDPCGVVTYTTPAGSDNCAIQSVVCTPASGTCFPVGMTTVTCTATDTSNNTGQCTFKITVQSPCTIACPASITKNNDANQCGAVVTFAPTTTGGGCGAVSCSPASGSFFPKGTTTVTCTTAGPSCSFTVTVNDTQPPNITCPANIVKGTDPNVCQAVVTYPLPSVSDNCPGVAAPTCSPTSGTTFPKGSTTVACSVKDSSNNTSMCSFMVTVNDTQPPAFEKDPAAIMMAAHVSCPITTRSKVNYTNPVATDNCAPAPTVVCNPPSGSMFPPGKTMVTCTATDSSGNVAAVSFPVNVYSLCLQDDSMSANVAFVNAVTGEYMFCSNGMPLASGTGTLTVHGCNFQIDHMKGDRKVHIQGDTTANGGAGSGTAYIQKAGGGFVVQITDRKMSDDTSTCASPSPPGSKK